MGPETSPVTAPSLPQYRFCAPMLDVRALGFGHGRCKVRETEDRSRSRSRSTSFTSG